MSAAGKPSSSRQGAQTGSGGKGYRALRPKGPTPRAERRPGHPAARRSGVVTGAAEPRQNSSTRSGSTTSQPRKFGKASAEFIGGRNSVLEALTAGVPASVLYIGQHLGSDDRVRRVLELAAEAGISRVEASRLELDRFTRGTVHQGLALHIVPYSYDHPEDLLTRAAAKGEVPLLVALDGVTDPRNLGAVVRSVAAFGGHGVLVPERRSAGMTAGAWKSSAGAAARVPVARAVNLTRALAGYRKAGLLVIGLAADGSISLGSLETAHEPLVLVVGSEATGLSRLVRQTCDLLVTIPMAQGAESLNAGVAAGVALYEVSRNRRSG